MRNGQFAENGTYDDLMAKDDGVLKRLIREHVEKENMAIKDSGNLPSGNQLTDIELVNRLKKAGVRNSLLDQATNASIVARMEGNRPPTLVSSGDPVLRRRPSAESRMSNRGNEPIPEDAEPMKLVLEDQSIYYKEIPFWSYLKAGTGVILTLIIFAFFFLVHGVRIGSGKLSIHFFHSNTSKNDPILCEFCHFRLLAKSKVSKIDGLLSRYNRCHILGRLRWSGLPLYIWHSYKRHRILDQFNQKVDHIP